MNRFQKMLVSALVVASVWMGVQPAAADPAGATVLDGEKSLIGQRIHANKYSNPFQRERGASGLLKADRSANRLNIDKGSNGSLTQQRRSNNETPRFLSRGNAVSALRSQTFFASKQTSNLQLGKNVFQGGHRAAGSLLHTDQYFHTGSAFATRSRTATRRIAPAPVALNDLGFVRATMSKFFTQNTLGALFIQKDARTGKTYRLQFAQAPVTRQVSNSRAAVRCSFYGQTSANSPSVPVVVEYTLTGGGSNWQVSNAQFVSVNGQRFAGNFDIDEAELIQNASALDEKAFPVKSL